MFGSSSLLASVLLTDAKLTLDPYLEIMWFLTFASHISSFVNTLCWKNTP